MGGNAVSGLLESTGAYGFEYDDNNAYGEEQTVTLHPGDVFYFPSGMWHRVETVEPGICLNVTANENPRHIVGIFKTSRICRQYITKWLIQHQNLANSTEVVLK